MGTKQVILIGAYAKESDFQKQLNEVLLKEKSNHIKIKYQMALNETEVLYSALVIITKGKAK